MRATILLSASRAHYRPLHPTKSHHISFLLTPLTVPPHHHHFPRHNSSSNTTKPPLQLSPSDLNYNKILNPPPTTRPPPFSIPPSDPSLSLPRNLLNKGKSILTFYKTGLKSILINRRLHSTPLSSLPEDLKPLKPYPDTRAALLLASRLKHDLGRLIPLSLIILICAEMTPVVILWAPNLKLTPLTCRMPREVEAIRQRDREMKKEAKLNHQQQQQRKTNRQSDEGDLATVGELLRVGKPRFVPSFLYPFAFRKAKADKKLAWILADDAMLQQGGGQKELVFEEVKLAAEERGIDVLGRDEEELRGVLQRWLDLMTTTEEDLDLRRELVKTMVLTGEKEWEKLRLGVRAGQVPESV